MVQELSLNEIKLTDKFWKNYQELVKETVIPYQYEVLDDALEIDVQAERKDDSLPQGKSHALENFRITAGVSEGTHFGWFFQDSDVYKWLEAVGYSLSNQSDPILEELADDVITLIGQSQAEDGYLNTYFQLKEPNLKYRALYFSHELYCAGHLIEAAIAYDQGTGKKALLIIAEKIVANIQQHFGPESGKIHGADGHQEIELALVRLYEHTGKNSYLDLAHYFIDIRGKDPLFYQKEAEKNFEEGLSAELVKVDTIYLQANEQPKNQRIAQGHAVRMLYMATAMAKIAKHTKDEALLVACQSMWTDITKKKMYLTGGVGSTVHGEAFTIAYDLPNDTMYCETCASIALVYFAYEMFKIEPIKEYLEVLERALYNGVLAGVATDGKHFFYVNPLEVQPMSCHHNPGKGHVKTTRPDWLGCACCPPNFARLIASLQKYVYSQNEMDLYVNLFVNSELKIKNFELVQKTHFPYANEVVIETKGNRTLFIRKPEWAQNIQVESQAHIEETDDFFIVTVADESQMHIIFEQPVLAVASHPNVWQNHKRLAIQRGPFVYCGEGTDNGNDLSLYRVNVTGIQQGKVKITNEILNQTLTLRIPSQKVKPWDDNHLYQYLDKASTGKTSELVLIPYHLWGNRVENEMRVWFPAD